MSSGVSSILYTVTYLGTEILPEEGPSFDGSTLVIPVIGGAILLATLLSCTYVNRYFITVNFKFIY